MAVYQIQGIGRNQEFGAQTIMSAVGNGGGAGDTYVLPGLMSRFTWSTALIGSPTGVSATLQGSIDGTTWFTIDTSISTTNETRHVVNKTVAYLRGGDPTLTGGTAPKVSIKVAGAKQ